MSRIANGLTGQVLLATVQAEENRGFSIQDMAVKCGYVTVRGTARVPQFKVAVADASGVYFGRTIPGDVPAQRSGTTNRFKAQKNGILVTAKRFLTEIGVTAGTYANVMVAEVEGNVIDTSAFDFAEGAKVVIIVKNHDPVMDDEDSEEEEADEDSEEDEDEDTDDAPEAPTPSPTFIPDPLDPTPAPMTTTVRIAQPV